MFSLLFSDFTACCILLFVGTGISGSPERADTAGYAFSQSFISEPADTIIFDPITVESTRIYEPAEVQPVDVQVIDPLRLQRYNSRPVSDLLSNYSTVFIRDNGPGTLAVMSQRGLSPSQTQILWEGFPINSLSLGLADLSLLPSGLFNRVEVSAGTPSSAFGGGSLGGTVYMSSFTGRQNNHLNFEQTLGAFNTHGSFLQTRYSTGRWRVSLTGTYKKADNDFEYFNRATQRIEQRTNNAGESLNLLGNINYELERGRIYTAAWYYNNEDEVPGNVLAGNSDALQNVAGSRIVAGAEYGVRGYRLQARSFFEQDEFRYNDERQGIDSRFENVKWMNELNVVRPSAGSVVWQGGLNGGYQSVETSNYAGIEDRTIISARFNPEIRLSGQTVRLTPTLRADRYSAFGWVVSPSAGINWEAVSSRFYLRGMISRDFNPPSFNDLYWVPGGNPDLKPEQSFKTEGGFTYLSGLPLLRNIRFTVYRIWLENGIYWFPDSGGTWTPKNVQEVDAYGFESSFSAGFSLSDLDFRIDAGLDYRRSVIGSERFDGDQGTGRQLRYVPEWTGRSAVSVNYRTLMAELNYRWTGRRYVTQDHTSSLDPFGSADLSLAANRTIQGTELRIRLSVNNLLDEQYEIIQWYPMPGRYLELSAGFRFPY